MGLYRTCSYAVCDCRDSRELQSAQLIEYQTEVSRASTFLADHTLWNMTCSGAAALGFLKCLHQRRPLPSLVRYTYEFGI